MSGLIEQSGASTRWVVSPLASVSWHDGRSEVTSASSGVRFAADDPDILRLLHAFAVPRTIEEVVAEFDGCEPETVATCVGEFIEARILTRASEPKTTAEYTWDAHALAYHRRSREVCQQHFSENSNSARSDARSLDIPLPRSAGETPRGFVEILDARRSIRTWPNVQVPFEKFSRFLWLSARNRSATTDKTGEEYVSRPYPSGGGVYSLELYAALAPEAVESLVGGLYRYLPRSHSLQSISERRDDYLPFLDAAARSATSSPPPILMLFTSRFARQSALYGQLAYSLVLKEVGCLFQTLYLVAEYLQLAPCALGGGSPSNLLSRLLKTDELAEPIVGEFMLGPRERIEVR